MLSGIERRVRQLKAKTYAPTARVSLRPEGLSERPLRGTSTAP